MSDTHPLIAGRYRLIHPLAEGSFGRVWEARDDVLRADVVVKEVRFPATADPVEQARRLSYAEREARNAARLRHHPGIVPVYDVATEDGRPWIVMQLVEGGSLEERLRTGRLPVSEAVELADVLLRALDAAHRADVVHRDVKPANVMVATDGRFMLTDFGIATHPTDTRLTTDGSVVGSLEYMAPERLTGDPGTPAGDLFSLGATLYHAVEGVSPFRRGSYPATMSAVAHDAPPPPRHARRLAPLLGALLAKDPEARPTVTEALALLHPAGKARNGRETPKIRSAPPQPPTVVEERPTPAFEESWTGDERPGSFSTCKTITVWGQGVYHCMLLLSFFGAAYLWGQGERTYAMGALMFGSVFGFTITERLLSRRLRKRTPARSLRLDRDGMTTTDPFGTQHIPWGAVARVSVHDTGLSEGHTFLALHLQMFDAEAGQPTSARYRPAGWPSEFPLPEISRRSEPPKRDDWVPVCVLGPIPEPRRIALRNAVATYTRHPLKTIDNW